MKTPAIKYADLLTLAEQCRTRPSSEWIDIERLCTALTYGGRATTVKAAAPDNMTAAVDCGERSTQKTFKSMEALSKALGVTRKTLYNWGQYLIKIQKHGNYYNLDEVLTQLKQFTQK